MKADISYDLEVDLDDVGNLIFVRKGKGPQREREVLKLNSEETNNLSMFIKGLLDDGK